jgi:hypothetical protein
MKIDGSCQCGAITFEAEVDPQRASICHCVDCQKFSGSAFRTSIPAQEGTFRVLSGEPKVYVKTAESGSKRAQGFCPDCGCSIYATAVGEGPKTYNLRIGVISQSDQLPPRRQIWYRSRRPWLGDLTSIPTVEKQA